jgi:hypothetical protein
MSTTEWFEHFKHKLQGLTESHTAGGSPLSLLAYALKENQLTPEDYFPWAMAHYKLPRLQARFFTETPPRKEMYAKWATHYSWSVECLPVAEWDGILVVACLQPPQDFPSTPQCVFVLAPQDSLEQCWNTWQSQAAKIPASAPTKAVAAESAMPEGFEAVTVIAPAKKSGDSFSFEDLGEFPDASDASASSEEGESSEESTGEEMGGLEGLFDTPVVKLQSTAAPETEAARELTPVDSILNPTSASAEEVEKTFDRTVVDARPTLAKVEPVLEKKAEPTVAAAASALTPTAAPAASKAGGPPPPPKDELPDLSEESFGNKPVPVVTRPTGIAKPTMNPVASGSFALEKLKKKNSGVIADKIKRVLSEMKSHFEKSMILTLDEQESQVTAFAWDENFQEIKDTSMRIPLKSPSIFNIVATTQKPFHGYISLNDLNENFFEQWNQGAIPDHVTITPIVINEKLVGMLMGFAEKSAYNKASLTLAEKLSTEFTKGLQAA